MVANDTATFDSYTIGQVVKAWVAVYYGLTITGDIKSFRIDGRPLEDIKKEQEDQKASILAQSESFTTKIDEVIAVIEPEIAKQPAPVVDEPVVPE